MCRYVEPLCKFKYLYFRTLPFDVFVRRAAEVKHKEYFLSEVIYLATQLLVSVILPVYGGENDAL